MTSVDLMWAVMAIRIQREVGGNLAELLDTVADTMTQRERLRLEIKALTAEGRFSGWILGLFPIVFAGILYAIQPDYMGVLFQESIGIMAIIACAIMSTTATTIMTIPSGFDHRIPMYSGRTMTRYDANTIGSAPRMIAERRPSAESTCT